MDNKIWTFNICLSTAAVEYGIFHMEDNFIEQKPPLASKWNFLSYVNNTIPKDVTYLENIKKNKINWGNRKCSAMRKGGASWTMK